MPAADYTSAVHKCEKATKTSCLTTDTEQEKSASDSDDDAMDELPDFTLNRYIYICCATFSVCNSFPISRHFQGQTSDQN